jgi:hypothetical protein
MRVYIIFCFSKIINVIAKQRTQLHITVAIFWLVLTQKRGGAIVGGKYTPNRGATNPEKGGAK